MRALDCNNPKNGKSLIKAEWLFTESPVAYHGGTHGAKGRFFKCSNNQRSKPHYIAERPSFNEYFALEILNAIGFATPKARFVRTQDNTIRIATQAIEGFVPLQAFSTLWPGTTLLKNTPEIRETHAQYLLDHEQQIVKGKIRAQNFKVSGKLHVAHLAAELLYDPDLSGEGTNIGLVKEHGRFRAHFIDKEAAFHLKYTELSTIEPQGMQQIYTHKPNEQSTAVLYAIKNLIQIDPATNKSLLERIFFNPRTVSIYSAYLQNVLKRSLTNRLDNMLKRLEVNPKLQSKSKLDQQLRELKEHIKDNFYKQCACKPIEPQSPLADAQSITDLIVAVEKQALAVIRTSVANFPGYEQLKQDVIILITSTTNAPPVLANQGQLSLEDFICTQFEEYYKSKKGYIKTYYPIDPVLMYNTVLNNANTMLAREKARINNWVEQFENRESHRQQIVNSVKAMFQKELGPVTFKPSFTDDLMDDLRGPYYGRLFKREFYGASWAISIDDCSNQELISAIYNDNKPFVQDYLVTKPSDQRTYMTKTAT